MPSHQLITQLSFFYHENLRYHDPMENLNESNLLPNSEVLLKLARYKMPYGKYANRLLIDLPEPYVVWFSKKGFPEGELGNMMRMIYEIKLNGLEYLFEPLRKIRTNK